MREYEDGPSGQSLDAILHLKIEIIMLNPMRAGCHIPLPKVIANKVACINPQNVDNKCMLFAIELPVRVTDVAKLEHQNDLSINVYMLNFVDRKYIVSPVHCTSNKKSKHVHFFHF